MEDRDENKAIQLSLFIINEKFEDMDFVSLTIISGLLAYFCFPDKIP
jgi:hypothetical protein